MNGPAQTSVHRDRTDHWLREVMGLSFALSCMADQSSECPGFALRAIADVLQFRLEKLCEEHGLDAEGRRA